MITHRLSILLGSAACFVALFCGCSTHGIRKLEDTELSYYQALGAQLKTNKADLAKLHKIAATVDELALQEIARFEFQLESSKTVYSVREMLTAPAGDSAAFIQNTRNKVLLYYLSDAAAEADSHVNDEIAAVRSLQQKLQSLENQLLVNVQDTIESEKLIHNHLNKGAVDNIRDSVAEVSRQLGAFNEEIKGADQANPTIKTLTEDSKKLSSIAESTTKGLDKFIDIWAKLNKP